MAPCPIVCERVHFHSVKGREEHTNPKACFMNHSLSSEEEDAVRQIPKCFWESQPIEQPAASRPCFIRAGCFLPTREGELPLTPICRMTDSQNSACIQHILHSLGNCVAGTESRMLWSVWAYGHG